MHTSRSEDFKRALSSSQFCVFVLFDSFGEHSDLFVSVSVEVKSGLDTVAKEEVMNGNRLLYSTSLK